MPALRQRAPAGQTRKGETCSERVGVGSRRIMTASVKWDQDRLGTTNESRMSRGTSNSGQMLDYNVLFSRVDVEAAGDKLRQ